jgi:hypothetical protein
MDDLTLVREFFDEPATPAPAVVAEARRRAFDARPAPRTSWKPTRVAIGGLGVAATTAAVAAAVTISGTSPVPGGQDGTTRLSARQVLLAAAVQTTNAAPSNGTGRYWRMQVKAYHEDNVQPAKGFEPKPQPKGTVAQLGHPFAMARYGAGCEGDVWAARVARNPSWMIIRQESAHLLSAGDEPLWKKEGSPPYGWCDLGMGGMAGDLAQPSASRVGPGTNWGYPTVDGLQVSLDQISKLPTDPAALRRVLETWTESATDKSAWEFVHEPYESQRILFSQARDLLFLVPAPPKVRAAMFRILADLPLARTTGTVKDPLGRPGVGVRLAPPRNTSHLVWNVDSIVLIIDPRTGTLLATQQPDRKSGKLVDYLAVVKEGWTDQNPDLPAQRF